jgi:hypothetical protein
LQHAIGGDADSLGAFGPPFGNGGCDVNIRQQAGSLALWLSWRCSRP